ncbi:MAG TPA: putative ABC exporter domain-containing protein, partial [Thermoanaerobaculia bacterium]|nr:putative ABC exporter domain-containing protein [Thermoanaerobaculia bacterium]
MIRAFFFVTLRSLKNRTIRRLRMLRQPRYLFGAILAMLWFSQFIVRRGMPRPLHWGQRSQLMADALTIPVLLVMLLAWLVPNQSLAFAAGEAHFLFSAPLRRRDILLYKLVRSQISVLISVSVMTLFRLPVIAAIGVWACFTTMGIYLMFVELGRERLRKAGVSIVWQVLAICAIIALVVAAFVVYSHKPAMKG